MCMHRRPLKRLSASVVCEGFWQRKSPWTNADVTKHYNATHRDWYGVPRHRTTVTFEDGSSKTFTGTYRSARCLKLAINYDNSPTGTMTCNQCARVPTLPSFTSATQQDDRLSVRTPNKFLSRDVLLIKLTRVHNEVRTLRRKVVRQVQRKRTLAAKEALARDDVKKNCKELQFIAQRDTLEDKKSHVVLLAGRGAM